MSINAFGVSARRAHFAVLKNNRGGLLAATLFTAALFSFAFAGVALAAGNLITNPSFEVGTENSADNWSKGEFKPNGPSDHDAVFSVVGDANSGSRAGQVAITAYTAGDAKWAHNAVAVVADGHYSYSFWYKSTAEVVSVFLVFPSNDFRWQADLPAAAEWTKYEGSFFVPDGAGSVQVVAVLAGVGELITDDYAIEAIDSFAEGRVSFTFDDGWKSFSDNAAPILLSKGYRATAYINSEPVELGWNGYMTASDLQALVAQSFDIGGHTTTHADLTDLPPSKTLVSEVDDNKNYLESIISSTLKSFAYPYGAFNDEVVAHVAGVGYLGARTVNQGYNFTNYNPFELKIQHVRNNTSAGEIQDWIDTAVSNNTWLILMFHDIVPAENFPGDCITNDLTECTTTAVLQSTVDYLFENEVCVLTMAQALSGEPCGTLPPEVCPEGQVGTFPDCTDPEPEVCPEGQVGTFPDCTDPEPEVCPEGQVGTFPDCTDPEPEVCPEGQTGTPPNCETPEPEVCPEGQVGTFPDCTDPEPEVCPEGQVGTFPDCSDPEPVVDVCTNIEGVQAVLPEGYAVNDGICTELPAEEEEEETPAPTTSGGSGGGSSSGGGGIVWCTDTIRTFCKDRAAFFGVGGIGGAGEVLGAQSSLTEEQIDAILEVLRSFGADRETREKVEKALRGQSFGGEVAGATAGFIFTQTLGLGSRGNEVVELHKVLIARGYLQIAAPTGYFGGLTQAALKQYQAMHGIPAVGVVGPLTRAALNAGN